MMAALCNGTHSEGDLYQCHNLTRLEELNRERAILLIPVAIYLGLLMVVGIFGNILALYVYYFRFKKTPSNYFVLCLAMLDMLTCLFAAPFEIYDVAQPLMFDMPVACKIMRFLETVTTVASGITLVAVAWDRYRKVFKPFKRMSNKQSKIMSFVALGIGILFAWPTAFIYGSKHVQTTDPEIIGISCSTSDSVRRKVYPKVYSGMLLILFLVSVGFLVSLYSKVGLEIRKRGRMRLSHTPTSLKINDTSLSMEPGEEESSSAGENGPKDTRRTHKYHIEIPTSSPSETPRPMGRSLSNGQKTCSQLGSPNSLAVPDLNQSVASRAGYNSGKTTRILFSVSVAFVLSFLPYVIVKTVQAVNTGFDIFPNTAALIAYNFATRSFLINAAVNPVIYSYLNEAFRKECKQLLQKCLKKFRP